MPDDEVTPISDPVVTPVSDVTVDDSGTTVVGYPPSTSTEYSETPVTSADGPGVGPGSESEGA